MEGWIKIYRRIEKHWIFKDPDKFRSWILILLNVNHEENKVLIGEKLFVCGRGESLNSLETWAKIFGRNWNKSSVRRFFDLLKNDSMIVLKNEQKTTRLTVCNYDSYQEARNASETQVKRKRNASETSLTPNKKDKNVKKDKNEEIEGTQKRIDLFKKTLIPFKQKYGVTILEEFFIYWSELNVSKTKARFEGEKFWSLSARLSTWKKRDGKFFKKDATVSDEIMDFKYDPNL